MMLSCKNLSYNVSGKNIISNINFELEQGQNLLILGSSGSGKTTMLCMLAGLLMPTSGNISYDELEIYNLPRVKRDQFRGQNLGIIFQNFHLIKSLNIYQNIELALNLSNKPINKKQIYNYLKNLGLWEKARQNVSSLSLGEKQRVAIVRSFINRPKYVFCDEPTSALDDDNSEKILTLLTKESKAANSSLVIVTHDKRVQSFFKNDQILSLT